MNADPRWVLLVIGSLFISIRKDPIPDTNICVKGCAGLISGNVPGSSLTGILMKNCLSCVTWSG